MVKFLLYASLTKRPMQVARDQLGKHGVEGGVLQKRLHAVATAGSGEGQYGVLLLASHGFWSSRVLLIIADCRQTEEGGPNINGWPLEGHVVLPGRYVCGEDMPCEAGMCVPYHMWVTTAPASECWPALHGRA